MLCITRLNDQCAVRMAKGCFVFAYGLVYNSSMIQIVVIFVIKNNSNNRYSNRELFV